MLGCWRFGWCDGGGGVLGYRIWLLLGLTVVALASWKFDDSSGLRLGVLWFPGGGGGGLVFYCFFIF